MTPTPGVLSAWGLEDAELTLLESGHINRTYRVDYATTRFILQRVHPTFGPEIHEDIQAVTARLLERGVPTPTLVPTLDGQLFVQRDGVWRVLTFAPGRTYEKVTHPELVDSAGALLARFHGALAGLDHSFRSKRAAIHDTARHLRALTEALRSHLDHPMRSTVEKIAAEIFACLDPLPRFDSLPARVVHGDPKISNVLFDESNRAHCLVDLDTLGRMSVVLELGDALRSWCNPAAEDAGAAHVDRERFDAAISGYLQSDQIVLEPEERDALVTGFEVIALELAARFATDALNESYFAWDAARYPSASAHHVERSKTQLCLARSVAEQRGALEAVVKEAAGRAGASKAN